MYASEIKDNFTFETNEIANNIIVYAKKSLSNTI